MHIEQRWQENAPTVSGHMMHGRVHDENFTESCGSVLLSRGMPVSLQQLRLAGECGPVGLKQHRHTRSDTWQGVPVEYKCGQPDGRGADEVQLCAQALCREEMLVTEIPDGVSPGTVPTMAFERRILCLNVSGCRATRQTQASDSLRNGLSARQCPSLYVGLSLPQQGRALWRIARSFGR